VVPVAPPPFPYAFRWNTPPLYCGFCLGTSYFHVCARGGFSCVPTEFFPDLGAFSSPLTPLTSALAACFFSPLHLEPFRATRERSLFWFVFFPRFETEKHWGRPPPSAGAALGNLASNGVAWGIFEETPQLRLLLVSFFPGPVCLGVFDDFF